VPERESNLDGHGQVRDRHLLHLMHLQILAQAARLTACAKRVLVPGKARTGHAAQAAPHLAEVADTAAFIGSDRTGAMTATVVNLSAGGITD
jgi:D-arabinose 5-phosphate isomerase GutQ